MESDLTALSRDSLTFAAARALYLARGEETAVRSLRSYVENYPKGYYVTDALYYLSDCYLRQNRRDEAIGTLTTLATQGTNQYTVQVLEQLSSLTFERPLRSLPRPTVASTTWRRRLRAARPP